MPSLFHSSAPKSLFDGVDDKRGEPQATASSSTAQATQDPYTSTRKPDLDPEVSSIFTQSTLGPAESVYQPNATSSRFGFLKRNKSKSDQQQQTTLLPSNDSNTNQQVKEKKKSRFENPFKPHEQTDEDRAIMEKMRQRLGSREEAVRQGGAQPAGFRGVGGAQAMAMPWNGGM